MDRPESPPMSRVCAVCRQKAAQICGGCGEVAYCSKEHQKQHWPTHKPNCKPYKITFDAKLGRCLVATKNLKAGEIIFREKAAFTGPKQECRPLCLTCYGSLENVETASIFRCPTCNFPFCQEQCAKNPAHAAECAVLSKAKSRITIDDMTKPHPVYQCISPLRGVLLKKTHPKLYEEFCGLQHHNELRRNMPLWNVYDVNVVNFLRNVCGMADDVTEDEIHSACGALDVNAFEIRLPSNGQRVLGLFLLASMMAHNCVSNMSHVIDANYQMTVRASVPIHRGEQIFASYALSLEGTKERRAHLRQSKFFECDCARCSDPTELGTFVSALRCQKCPTGKVLPVRPLDENETEWRCDQCDYKLTAAVVSRVIDKMKEDYEAIGSNQVDKFEGFLTRHAKLVHANHFLFTNVKHSLSQLYGRDEHFLLNALSSEQLQRKVTICRELLSVANVVEPGFSRLRGVTLYELHAPMLLLARRTFENDQCTASEFKAKIEQVRTILAEATKILSLEDPAAPEGAMGTAAVQALDQIQRWISTL